MFQILMTDVYIYSTFRGFEILQLIHISIRLNTLNGNGYTPYIDINYRRSQVNRFFIIGALNAVKLDVCHKAITVIINSYSLDLPTQLQRFCFRFATFNQFKLFPCLKIWRLMASYFYSASPADFHVQVHGISLWPQPVNRDGELGSLLAYWI